MARQRPASRRSALAAVAALTLAACEPAAEHRDPQPAGHTVQSTAPQQRVLDHQSGIVFVLVPAGEFTMGGAQRDELPRHRVRLSAPFWLATTEVTTAQWRRFATSTDAPAVPLPPEGDDGPIHVSHDEATAYCRHFGYELPTEAQWEWACRAGDDTVPTVIDLDTIAASAWFHRNAGEHPMPVATRRANGFGLHDMLGNVWEWCADRYGPAYAAAELSEDPRGPAAGDHRVLRGGSWFSLPPALPWTRAQEHPSVRTCYVGFRPACAERTFAH